MKIGFTLWMVLVFGFESSAFAQYSGWKHSGSVFVMTTPEGADLPGLAEVRDFPVLVRLHQDSFDFRQANPRGDDLRFTTETGEPLPYQVEEWDPKAGKASLWVRLPLVRGNSRQELKLYWGNADAKPESNGKAVFNESNGYLSVCHMTDLTTDEVGKISFKDTGTTPSAGVIGSARHFPGEKGFHGGDRIGNYPSGSSAHSTEAWFRAELPNTTIIGWGNEAGGRGSKVRMQFRSPPHLHIDSNFSDVDAPKRVPLKEWVHVSHTYADRVGRIYLNGVLAAEARPTLNIKSPARLWIGGWSDDYDFVGDIDEVRISQVARSAAWIKLQYENQKPIQTLVGPVVQPGQEFSVSEVPGTVDEGKSVTLKAKAGGAQKISWIVNRGGRETIEATDRFNFTLEAGRVVGDQRASVRFQAIYPEGVKTKDVAIVIKEAIVDPTFTLKAPDRWDGRETIEIVPEILNRNVLQEAGADNLRYTWTIASLAVIKEVRPDRLVLTRAQNSGPMTVTVAIDNGGQPSVQSTSILVTEPAKDVWVTRTPSKDERPVDGQFFARDDKNEGKLHDIGMLPGSADSVFLKVFADDKPYTSRTQKLGSDRSYAFEVKLKPGLVKYRVEFGSMVGETETVLHQASNLVCGDAYLIHGQSNAVATDFGKETPSFRSEWIRTFGTMSGDSKSFAGWGNATYREINSEKLQVGYWGMELGRRLVEAQKVPVCLINGAVGGTRIDQHQRNTADPTDENTIYGRLLWRVQQARLTHGIRGIIWHQGENDQGADGPSGGYGWERYRQYFIDLAASWKQDFPNVEHYYLFQIWPNSCSMGINGSDNRLREVQRNLPSAFSHLSIMSTLGVNPPGGCHFPAAGYAEFARLIGPLIERDFYGKVPTDSITPPNLKRVAFTTEAKDEVVLEFDQPVRWDEALVSQFFLDGAKSQVTSGSTVGKTLTLKLRTPTTARTLTYLDSASWSQKTLLKGENGLAALTFCEVLIEPSK